MMAHNSQTVLKLVKSRLNRLDSDYTLDEYFVQRISAADEELRKTGIRLKKDDIDDQIFLADFVAWHYNNRDKPGGMPDWMRLWRRERWLKERQAEDDT